MIDFNDIELGEKYPILQLYRLNDYDKQWVADHIVSCKPKEGEWVAKKDFDAIWKELGGKDVFWRDDSGKKLTTRLKSLLYREYGAKLGEIALKNIGNYFARLIVSEAELYVEFTDDFNWKAGDFGDDGSCFWGTRSWTRPVIKANGGRAVKIWRKDGEKLSGFARAWVGQCENGFVIFNAYGTNLEALAKLLADAFGLKAVHVESVQKSDVYFNSGGAWSITSDGLKRWDLTWRSMIECPKCKKIEKWRDGIRDTGQRNKEGHLEVFCEECAKNVFLCPCCNKQDEFKNLKEFKPKGNKYTNTYYQCPNCYEIIGTRCPVCEKFAYGSQVKEAKDGEAKSLVHSKECAKE